MQQRAPKQMGFFGSNMSKLWLRQTSFVGKVEMSQSIFRRFFSLYFTHYSQGVFITLPFVLAAYMVRDFVTDADEQELGRLIGLVGAAFCAAQLLTSYLIGRLSDRIGRKPVIVIGNLSCIFSALMFGLSNSYSLAITSRVVGGLFNGIIGAEKAMLGEALSVVDQGIAFSYFSIAWGVGALTGPLVGGVFSYPCSHLLQSTRLCSQGSLLQRQPFLLPCLVAAGISGMALVLTICCLEETLPRLVQGSGGDEEQGQQPGRGAGGTKGRYRAVPGQAEDGGEEEAEVGLWGQPRHSVVKGSLLPQAGSARGEGEWGVELGTLQGRIAAVHGEERGQGQRADRQGWDAEAQPGGCSSSSSSPTAGTGVSAPQQPSPVKGDSVGSCGAARSGGAGGAARGLEAAAKVLGIPGGGGSSGEEARVPWHGDLAGGAQQEGGGGAAEHGQWEAAGDEEGRALLPAHAVGDAPAAVEQAARSGPLPSPAPRPGSSSPPLPPWYKQQPVLLALTGYGLIAFYYSMSDELVPIYASAPVNKGGVGLTTSQLAPSLTFGGATLMLWALFVFPVLLRRFGALRVCKTGLWATPLFALLYPVASLVVPSMALIQLVMFLAMGLKGVASTNAFTACIIMVNNAAPRNSLGSVNGVGQTIASAVRAAAPALGGLVWGVSSSLGFQGQQFIPFICVSVVALGTLFVYRYVQSPGAEVAVEMKDTGRRSCCKQEGSNDTA